MLLGQPVHRPGAQRLVRPRVDLEKPGVELVLEVELVSESSPRLEVRLRIALQPLDRALGLRVGGLTEPPRDPKLAAERGERVRRPPAVAVDPGLAIPHQLLRQRPQTRQTARDPRQQILGLLGEHQHPRARARIPQTRDHDPALTRLAVPDRDLPRGAATHRTGTPRPVDTASAETSAPAGRTTAGPRADSHPRPSCPRCTPTAQQLPDPHPRQLRILRQQPVDLRLERLQHARPRCPLISRRRLAAQRPADRVLRQARLTHQPLDRLARDEMLASQLGPLLHLDHPLAALSRR